MGELPLSRAGLRVFANQREGAGEREVKIEAINVLASSDAFAAKWLVLNALRDDDEAIVIAALEHIELWQDSSTVAYVEAVRQQTTNSEILELASSIVELNADFDTIAVEALTPEQKNIERREARTRMQRAMQHRKIELVSRGNEASLGVRPGSSPGNGGKTTR